MVAIAYGTLPPALQVIYVNDLNADYTGNVDCTAVIRAAQAAAGTDPYKLVFGVGSYLIGTSEDLLPFGPNQGVAGMGRAYTNITYAGSGSCLSTLYTDTFNDSLTAGEITGLTLTGPYSDGSQVGITFGNLQAALVDDIGIYGFPGGAAVGTDSGGGWAEQGTWTRIVAVFCGATSGFVFGFSGGSFDYSILDAVVVAAANVDVISLSDGANLQGRQFALRGNLQGGVSNTGAIVAIDRGNADGTSFLSNATFAVSMEANAPGDGDTVGHYLLWMGSANPVSQFNATGVLNLDNAGAASQGVYNPDFCPAAFSGITLDPAGGAMTAGDALAVMGGTCWTPFGDGFTSPYELNIYWQFGDVQTALLAAGANGTFTFNGASGFIKRCTLLLKEPSSGTAPTASWPANAVWLGGTTPTFASSGRIHEITCKYLPAETTWLLKYEGNYA